MSGEVVVPPDDSLSTSATSSSSGSGSDENAAGERPSYVDKSVALKEMRRKEREAKSRFDKVWQHSVAGDALLGDDEIIDPEQAKHEDEKDPAMLAKKDIAVEKDGNRYLKRLFFAALVILLLAGASSTPFAIKAMNKKSVASLVFETAPPTASIAPSPVPSASLVPSTRPTDVPSTEPSISSMPSPEPSFSPSQSMIPSNFPTESGVPSFLPSQAPSDSIQPSFAPTNLPSVEPTLSMEPTFQPVSTNWRFKLRLHWQPGYFWQEETTERYWCLECVRCDEYGRVCTILADMLSL